MKFVAEIGSNWLGDIGRAIAHVDAASKMGATGVKFQLFRAKTLYERGMPALEPFELQHSDIQQLHDHAHSCTPPLDFSITPFAPNLVGWLDGLVDEVKISAYDLTYDALILEAAALGVPVVLSTAMATQEEIRHARDLVWNVQDAAHMAMNLSQPTLTLLHGVAAYPAPPQDCNLRAIATLKDWFPSCAMGLSDHATGIMAAIAATTFGATHIEKHFILRGKGWKASPDAKHSIGRVQFKEMVSRCHVVNTMLGTPEKLGALPVEQPLFSTCRRTNTQPLRRSLDRKTSMEPA